MTHATITCGLCGDDLDLAAPATVVSVGPGHAPLAPSTWVHASCLAAEGHS